MPEVDQAPAAPPTHADAPAVPEPHPPATPDHSEPAHAQPAATERPEHDDGSEQPDHDTPHPPDPHAPEHDAPQPPADHAPLPPDHGVPPPPDHGVPPPAPEPPRETVPAAGSLPDPTVPSAQLVALSRLGPSDLTYEGAFRLPSSGFDDRRTFAYGGRGLAFNPAGNSLFIAGHEWYQWLAEITIPDPRVAHSVAGLSTATFRQPFTSVFERFSTVGWGVALGGLLVDENALVATAYVTYDANATQTRSHFRRGTDLADPTIAGGFRLAGVGAGYVAGYMAPIPAEWQGALGGRALTGQCCISIISRTSLGPSATVFDPAALVDPEMAVPAAQVLGYPLSQPTLGGCEETSASFNCSTMMGGMVFPDGTRSVLFFGRQGIGPYCYGTGGTSGECYDPSDSGKGTHAFPYVYQVWAYDALDLAAVRRGELPPWAIAPYRTWSFDLPFATGSRLIRSVTYDQPSRRIYIAAAFGDGDAPLIHVMRVR